MSSQRWREILDGRLRLPVIGAPLFIVSNPKLVIAQCTSGIVGAFPALNARPASRLDEWLSEIEEALAAHDARHPDRPAAPYAVNQIVHRSNERLEHDMQVCERYKVPIVITSLGARPELNQAVHGWGGITLHDIINQTFARKAIEKGADGLIAVAAGAGGHAGMTSPFALIGEIREWFDGPLALSGAIATGRAIRAAEAMGADFAYIGSPFIATEEANAPERYKQMIVECGADDIVYSDVFTGVHGNYLAPSIAASGIDPAKLAEVQAVTMDFGGGRDEKRDQKAWRDIWGSGQGIGAVKSVTGAGELVDRLAREYEAAGRAPSRLALRDAQTPAAAGDAGNVVINGKSVAVAAGDTIDTLVGRINSTPNIGVTAALDSTGKLKLTSNDPFSSFTINGTAGTPPSTAATLTALGLTAATTASTNPIEGKTLTFTVGTAAPITVTFGDPAVTPGATKTLDDLNTKLSSVGLSATLDGQGSLSFTTTTRTASQSFTIGGTLTGSGSKFTTTASTLPIRGGNGADSRDNLVTQYNNLLAQIDTLAKDASFNGINLLTGDTLSILFNERNSSRLDIAGTAATSAGLGLSNVTAADYADGDALSALLAQVERATTVLTSQASRFGSHLAVTQTRQDFTKALIVTLTTGADNLVNADLNEEGANLLALQTKQSLSQTALSLSTQADQSVLRLFS